MAISVIERVNALIKHKGMNAKTFSEFIGFKRPQVIYDLLKGKTRNISASMSEKILGNMPEVSRNWLLTGDGEMLVGAVSKSNAASEVTTVPLLPMSAFAGPINAYYQQGVMLDRCERIISPNPGADLALPVSGDSMEPVFPDGSIVFVKRINEAAFIPWGHPMVIDTENGVFIKNVMPDDANDAYIWAESVNPKYPRMHVPKKSINGMYRVLNFQKSYFTM